MTPPAKKRGSRYMLVLIGLIALVMVSAGGIFLTWRAAAHYFPALEGPLKKAPVQPIEFSHKLHAGTLGLQCTFCHRNANEGAAATVPALEQCMFCHKVIGRDSPEIDKMRFAWENDQPINWTRVHRMPDHVQFLHEPHMRAGFSCSTCHGEIEQMQRVRQVRSLKMGDCVNCHRENNAPTDCVTCHH